MDLEKRIKHLEMREAYFDRMIDSLDRTIVLACDQIISLQKEVDELKLTISKEQQTLWDAVTSNKNRLEMTAEKAYLAFYKLFPEVGEADDILDRIVLDQRKNPRDAS